MTSMQPPRLAERVLQALVPANDFGRGILGDLATRGRRFACRRGSAAESSDLVAPR